MKKLFIALMIITMLACSGGGDSAPNIPTDQQVEPQPPTGKPFVWGVSKWGDARWE